MDSAKKRGGKPGRPPRTLKQSSSSITPDIHIDDNSHELELSAVAISPIQDLEQDASNASSSSALNAAECRRSSRKKIIKFDVRDLLNKNRKPHKIQIEARIDSNTPAPKKATTAIDNNTTTPAATATSTKNSINFLEKSSMFEKYSSPIVKLTPLPIVNVKPDQKELKNTSSTMVRTPAVRGSSLILATMESNSTRTMRTAQAVAVDPITVESCTSISSESDAKQAQQPTQSKQLSERVSLNSSPASSVSSATPPIRRRGRPAKNKLHSNEQSIGSSLVIEVEVDSKFSTITTLTPSPQVQTSLSPTATAEQDTSSQSNDINQDTNSMQLTANTPKNEDLEQNNDSNMANMECIAGFDETAQHANTSEQLAPAKEQIRNSATPTKIGEISDTSTSKTITPPPSSSRRILTRRKTMHDKFLREISLTESDGEENECAVDTMPISTKARRAKKAKEQAEAAEEASKVTETKPVNEDAKIPKEAEEKHRDEQDTDVRDAQDVELEMRPLGLKFEEHRRSPKAELQLPPKKKLSKLLSKAIEQKAMIEAEWSDTSDWLSPTHSPTSESAKCSQPAKEFDEQSNTSVTESLSSAAPSKLVANKSSISPTYSEKQSLLQMRQLGRRSGSRRPRRGEDTSVVVGKTLEETFAEIAAASTRVVLQSPIIISDDDSLSKGPSDTGNTENLVEQQAETKKEPSPTRISQRSSPIDVSIAPTEEIVIIDDEVSTEATLEKEQEVIDVDLNLDERRSDEGQLEKTQTTLETAEAEQSKDETAAADSSKLADLQILNEENEKQTTEQSVVNEGIAEQANDQTIEEQSVEKTPEVETEAQKALQLSIQKIDEEPKDQSVIEQTIELSSDPEVPRKEELICEEKDKGQPEAESDIILKDNVANSSTKTISDEQELPTCEKNATPVDTPTEAKEPCKEYPNIPEPPSLELKENPEQIEKKKEKETKMESSTQKQEQLTPKPEEKSNAKRDSNSKKSAASEKSQKSKQTDDHRSHKSQRSSEKQRRKEEHKGSSPSAKSSAKKSSHRDNSSAVDEKAVQRTEPARRDKQKSGKSHREEQVASRSPESTPKQQKNKLKSESRNSSKVEIKNSPKPKKNMPDEETPKPSESVLQSPSPNAQQIKGDEDDKTNSKKKRQKRLKEAFEAAFKDEQEKRAELQKLEQVKPLEQKSQTDHQISPSQNTVEPSGTSTTEYALPPTPTPNDCDAEAPPETLLKRSEAKDSTVAKDTEAGGNVTGTANDSPDPLKDIEKFIADGVNLLKKDYTIDEDDSVEKDVRRTTGETKNTTANTAESGSNTTNPTESKSKAKHHDDLTEPTLTTDSICGSAMEATIAAAASGFSTYLTPATTPGSSPPPTPIDSPASSSLKCSTATDEEEESTGVRRSHRIKQIIKTPKNLVGRGLVREKERFMLKDDVETKISYSLDDHLTDLAEVEAKNVQFLKEMEERLCNFLLIKDNEYHCERVISKEARKMICECFLTPDEEERGELGCGDECLNRLLMIECGVNCKVRERCTNKRYQRQLYAPCRVFRTEKKGFGIMADVEILAGEFIMEYIGEVINGDELRKRQLAYSKDKNRHYYFMALRGDTTIDATIKGNISRFINHSCDPNAETQKWTVNGELRIGFFSLRSIKPGEEITFNYQYERYGRAAQRCYCESANCTGWIGEEPNSDEGEQVDDGSVSDDDDDEDDDEEEEDDLISDGKCLLDVDDASSDEEITDVAEAQKKLEMAAAEASLTEALTPEERKKFDSSTQSSEDSKQKLKQLFNKLAEREREKRKQKQQEKKTARRKRRKEPKPEKQRSLEDPDVEDEVNFLVRCGLKNQADTLRLSRLMVRAKLQQTRLDLLKVLGIGELACRRLFLDYNGLHLLHGWMSENGDNLQMRVALLETLSCLPIANKTVLKDTKVYQTVLGWSGATASTPEASSEPSPNEDSASNDSTKPSVSGAEASTATSSPPAASTVTSDTEESENLKKLGAELISNWNNLPEIFRIPKRERIEQMKEHEREADLQYAATGEDDNLRTSYKDRYERDRFGRGLTSSSSHESRKRAGQLGSTADESTKHLSKEQRREMFAAKVARDEKEKRAAEKRREFELKCRFFGLDPKTTSPDDVPFIVNAETGQWYSIDRKPIGTPPTYANMQLLVKPKSTDPNDYDLPGVCDTLPPSWRYAISPQGKLYYYHIDKRVPQWEPPTKEQIEAPNSDSDSDINRDDDELLLSMNDEQIKAFIKMKAEQKRQKRYKRLVQSRPISPRREEDRLHNQIEMRKYKENKEKIRKRKEKLRYRRIEKARAQMNAPEASNVSVSEAAATVSDSTTVTPTTPTTETSSSNSPNVNAVNEDIKIAAVDALPIPDYLLSSDEEVTQEANDGDAAVVNINKDLAEKVGTLPTDTTLLDKIVDGDKIVDELDAITLNKVLKRPLPPHGEILRTDSPVNTIVLATSTSNSSSVALAQGNTTNESLDPTPSTSASAQLDYNEQKKRKLEKRDKNRKSKESSESKYRRHKERFRTEIGGIIVHHLKPYYNETCARGRIQTEEDFLHLARKLTHFVMIKEQKYCESVGQKLVVTDSVRNKSREFIKKYMAKYGEVYIKSENDPEYKDINVSIEL